MPLVLDVAGSIKDILYFIKIRMIKKSPASKLAGLNDQA